MNRIVDFALRQRLLIVGGLIAVMVIVPSLLKRRFAKELHIEE